MDSKAWVELAIRELGCTQKELAEKCGVSQTQISKWKKGEHMSLDMEERLRKLTKISKQDPAFVLWAGSISAAKDWSKLLHYLANDAAEAAETGYDTAPLQDEHDLLCALTVEVLNEMGVVPPSSFPDELRIVINERGDLSDEQYDAIEDAISENGYASLISSIYFAFNDVYGFHAAYFSEIPGDADSELFDLHMDIDSSLLGLAASKADVDLSIAPLFADFKAKTVRQYKQWLTRYKELAFRAGMLFGAELLELIGEDLEVLRDAAEAESLGLNKSRLHPDVYMNELLVGMRMIHQVLPAILKKLEIYDDFQLNREELSLKNIPFD